MAGLLAHLIERSKDRVQRDPHVPPSLNERSPATGERPGLVWSGRAENARQMSSSSLQSQPTALRTTAAREDGCGPWLPW